jgi:hypothetical protein
VLKGAEGAVIVTPTPPIGVPMVPSTYLPPDYDAASVPLKPVVLAVWVLSVSLVLLFGALATFASPLFFLAVLVPFVPLAVLALRSD